MLLTHWSRVMRICFNKHANICSDNGLSPVRRQGIIYTNAAIFQLGSLYTRLRPSYHQGNDQDPHWSSKSHTDLFPPPIRLNYIVYNRTASFMGWPIGRPLCIHSATMTMRAPWLWSNLLGDLCATVLNMLRPSRRPWRPWRCLSVPCTTFERPNQRFGLLNDLYSGLVSFMVAQRRQKRSQPLCKWGIRY